jgi:hypothetical protein
VSPTQKGTLYIGAQFLFRSRDKGDGWERISPDLTSNDPQQQKQEQSGGQHTRHLFGPIRLEVLDAQGKSVDTIPATKRRGLNRVSWTMRMPAPRVPRDAQLAFNASQGPRVPPGAYTIKLTKGAQVLERTGSPCSAASCPRCRRSSTSWPAPRSAPSTMRCASGTWPPSPPPKPADGAHRRASLRHPPADRLRPGAVSGCRRRGERLEPKKKLIFFPEGGKPKRVS